MTVETFFLELERVQDRFEWELASAPGSPRESRAHRSLRLRAVPKVGAITENFDPLGAVCYALTGRAFRPKSWLNAAEALGMLPTDSWKLFAASNDRTWASPGGKRAPVPVLAAMRVRLIDTVGLAMKTD